MDFAYDDRTQDLRERLLAFMDEHVYPAEPVAAEQAEAAAAKVGSGSACRSPPNSRPRPGAAGCGTCS